jgi:FKBP-type peptidyl-prolyl cis-trans isomerase (trigger factor)
MKVTVETTGPCRKTLRVEFEAEEVQKEYDDRWRSMPSTGASRGSVRAARRWR